MFPLRNEASDGPGSKYISLSATTPDLFSELPKAFEEARPQGDQVPEIAV